VRLLQVTPPGEDVTRYDVIALPPSEVEAVQETVDEALTQLVALTFVGALGTVHGFAFAAILDFDVAPVLLFATTVKEYIVPFVRPKSVHEVVDTVQVAPPGDAVTV